MKQLFAYNRIKFDELLADTVTYITERYGDSVNKYTPASPWGQIVTVIEGLSQLMFYYIEDAITEQNILTASRPHSIYGLARLAGHNPTRSISASGTLRLTYNGTEMENYGNQIIVPNFSEVRCEKNGLTYVLLLAQDEIRIPVRPNATIEVKAVQGKVETQTFTGTGYPLQSFEANMLQGALADHFFVNVYVNGIKYTQYESLYDMPRGAKGVLVKTGITSGIDIYFGNGYLGDMPPLGSEIRVEYLISNGEAGNLREGTVTNWQFMSSGFDMLGQDLDLNQYIDVDIEKPITFGSNPEPTFLTRLIAPKTSRSFVLANPENYVIFLEKFNYFSLVDAFTDWDDDDVSDDNIIYLFLIPDIRKRLSSSENYFTVPQDQFTLTDNEKERVIDLIHDSGQMIVTTIVDIVNPVTTRYVCNVSLTIYEGFTKESIKNEIQSKLSEYFLTCRRRDRIPKSDLIAIIENITGVDSVNVNFVSEEYERAKELDANADLVGLDEFGDIAIGRGELPMVRGGWADRNGLFYEDTIDTDGRDVPGSLNIEFKRVVPKNLNTAMNRINVNQIRNK